jgi:hypothetical protein
MGQFDTGPGTVAGKVLEVREGSPMADANVCYKGVCDKTDAKGEYSIAGIPAGAQYLTATFEGYVPTSQRAGVEAKKTVTLNFAMSPYFLSTENVILRIVLIWGDTQFWPPNIENDLDAYWWIDSTLDFRIPSEVEPFNGDCTGPFPDSCLETDKRQGFGPETIAINEFHKGTSYYGVLNFNAAYAGVPPITQSEAQVQLYDETGLYETFTVPTSGTGDFWYVFKVTSDGNNAVIEPVNCITTYTGGIPSCSPTRSLTELVRLPKPQVLP